MPHHFELYEDRSGRYRFRLRANNGQVMVASSDAYHTPQAAEDAIRRVQSGRLASQIYQDGRGEYRWRMAEGGDTIAVSSEGYSTRRSCERSLESVEQRAAHCRVERLVTH